MAQARNEETTAHATPAACDLYHFSDVRGGAAERLLRPYMCYGRQRELVRAAAAAAGGRRSSSIDRSIITTGTAARGHR